MTKRNLHATLTANYACVALVCLLSCLPVNARELDNLEALQRETRIAADVMRAVLRDQLPKGIRATTVNAEYLAHQGVLLSIKLNTPWLVINDNETKFAFNGQIDLQDIPAMVENILAELQIDVAAYEPEVIDTIRELRDEQRELRMEQRELRSLLRNTRRELVRADSDKERRDLEKDIAEIERELQAAYAQYETLNRDIDAQYNVLKDYRGAVPPSQDTPPVPPTQLSDIIATTVCDYGATLRSLDDHHYLTVALRREHNAEFYVFEMAAVFDCSHGDIDAERLLELALRYNS